MELQQKVGAGEASTSLSAKSQSADDEHLVVSCVQLSSFLDMAQAALEAKNELLQVSSLLRGLLTPVAWKAASSSGPQTTQTLGLASRKLYSGSCVCVKAKLCSILSRGSLGELRNLKSGLSELLDRSASESTLLLTVVCCSALNDKAFVIQGQEWQEQLRDALEETVRVLLLTSAC